MERLARKIFSTYKNQIICTVIVLCFGTIIGYLSYYYTSTIAINIGVIIASYMLYLYSGYISKTQNDNILRLISFILLVLSVISTTIDAMFTFNNSGDDFMVKLSLALGFTIFISLPFIAFLLKNKEMNKEIVIQ